MKPILFNTQMVRAILDGKKTQTRRLVKIGNHSVIRGGFFPGAVEGLKYGAELDNHGVVVAPYQPGDILYVREAWSYSGKYRYRADGDIDMFKPWRPSIHMPKEAARFFLRVTDVRVEQLQDITAVGLQCEGVLPTGYLSQFAVMTSDCFEQWKTLWNGTIKPADISRFGWDANPWVWVIEFERCEKPEEW